MWQGPESEHPAAESPVSLHLVVTLKAVMADGAQGD